jgi:hypothetical protein
MKKYLFGLGAMLVGAGLMFVLIHGEVSAGSGPPNPSAFLCTGQGVQKLDKGIGGVNVIHCENRTLTCAYEPGAGLSCLKK